MNYEAIYNNIISIATHRECSSLTYYEKHHIIPKCLGGNNNASNIIKLTAKEHFICHRLLFRFKIGAEKVKMGYALHRMMFPNNSSQNERKITSRTYQILKVIYSFIRGPLHHWYGKNHSNESRMLCSISKKGELNPMYGKKPWNFELTKHDHPSLIKTEETCNKISRSLKGRKRSPEECKAISLGLTGKTKTTEHKEKISKKLKGRMLSDETKIKMSNTRQGKAQPKIECPYCNKVGGTAMHRWHFENCKNKPDESKH
jgi:hypothetical protein